MNTDLLKILETVEHTLVQGLGKANKHLEIKKIVIDSRNVTKGSMFVCIKGLRTDGHSYIKVAEENGAVAIVVEEDVVASSKDIAIIKVKDTRKALALMAASFYGYPNQSFKIIGVTGTNGKTSTTYFMESVLNELNRKVGIIGTVETRIEQEHVKVYYATGTTPDTVELWQIFAKMREEKVTDVAMEVSSHALQLEKVHGLNFDVALFTNLTQDHLDFHEDMESYKKAKAKLFTQCKHAIINADDGAARYMIDNAKNCSVTTVGINSSCDLKAENITYSSQGITFDVLIEGSLEHFKLPIPGKFSLYNALGVIGASLALNIPLEIIKKGLKNIKGVPGRIQSIPNNKGFNVFIDYAHTPDGLENIISAVKEFTMGRVITVFGCGGDRDKGKRPIMGDIAGRLSDFCIVTSDNPRTENPATIIEEIEKGLEPTGCKYEAVVDRKEAINLAVAMANKDDSIIIAGKGHENYQIFKEATVHFDDYEVAEEALDALQNF